MSAVGFDIGSEGVVVAVIRNRAVEVLQNEVGKRLTPNIVAFSGKQRLLGDQAIAQYMSNPKNSIKYIRQLLGKKIR
jgi:molecular chaperone DnaK (HSP70)